MGFRFQRRLNLGNGVGLNLSKSGVGASVRGRRGSIGTSGFSLRTGIPGLSYRQSWGKRGDSAAVFLILGLLALAGLAVVAAVQLALWLFPALFQAGRWCVLTMQDYIAYRRTGTQPLGDLASLELEDAKFDPNAKTLVEILAEREHSPPPLRPALLEEFRASRTNVASTLGASSTGTMDQPRIPNRTGAVIAGGIILGLISLLGMCQWLGGSNEPQFDASDLTAWRSVMLDADQPASVRLSNADAIINRFPDTPDASTAASLRPQLAEASAAESVQRNAEFSARDAKRQALIDRKERRATPQPSSGSSSLVTGAFAAGASSAALLSSGTERTPPGPLAGPTRSPAAPRGSTTQHRSRLNVRDATCPCAGSFNCTGPRGGQYCFTSGGKKRYRSSRSYGTSPLRSGGSCPCSGSTDCVGPRGGHFCITSGGKKRYR